MQFCGVGGALRIWLLEKHPKFNGQVAGTLVAGISGISHRRQGARTTAQPLVAETRLPRCGCGGVTVSAAVDSPVLLGLVIWIQQVVWAKCKALLQAPVIGLADGKLGNWLTSSVQGPASN